MCVNLPENQYSPIEDTMESIARKSSLSKLVFTCQYLNIILITDIVQSRLHKSLFLTEVNAAFAPDILF